MRSIAALLVLALPAVAIAQQAEPRSWSNTGLVLDIGAGVVAHENVGDAFVPLPGPSLAIDVWIAEWIGARVAYQFGWARRGVGDTWTLQLHHYATAQALLRAVIHRRAAIFGGVGAAVVVEQHEHHAPSNSVWAEAAYPAFAITLGVDATTPWIGVRFTIDAWMHPDFFDLGGGLHLLVPIL